MSGRVLYGHLFPPEWWPPVDEEPLGDERARELLDYLKQKAPKAAAFAREWLDEHYPGQEIKESPQSLWHLARATVKREDSYLYIGQLSITGVGSVIVQATFQLDRAGRITVAFMRHDCKGERTWSTVAVA